MGFFILGIYEGYRPWRRDKRTEDGIQDVILTIPGEILGNTWAEIEYRLDTLWATYGTQVEVY